ncbi:GNAT family N-acetyltransferase [Phanerochaete sordida]|uniref:GNAT family N-acetyltransferase n=1 Tax=Phanerochaete sordida TaxID=48140 RepID=A0A9P3GDD9_9APHY|nr:GNAT family N-acetyltransferase [Phanerochaete sordida]
MASQGTELAGGDLKPRKLGLADLSAAVHTVYVTRLQQLMRDSLLHYAYGSTAKPPSRTREMLFYILLYPAWANLLRQGKLWGVGHAYSLMVWGSASSQPKQPESPLSRIVGAILSRLSKLSGLLDTPEQKKRVKEFGEKAKLCVGESLGDKVQDMTTVEALLTLKEQRHKGYASSLVRAMMDQADEEGRGIWLVNSNIVDNTPFYESLGFKTVNYIVLGDDNPAWTGDPVKLALMVREPTARSKE